MAQQSVNDNTNVLENECSLSRKRTNLRHNRNFRTESAFGQSCRTTFILFFHFIMNQQRTAELLGETADALSSSAGPSPTNSSHSTNGIHSSHSTNGIQGPSSTGSRPSSCLQGQGTHVSGASGSGNMRLSSHLRQIFATYRTSHNFRPQAGRRPKPAERPDQGGPQWGHKFCLLAKTSQVWRATLL